MSIKKYLDWKGYFEGLYLSWIKNVTNTLIILGGSNAAEAMGPEALKGVGLGWKQACSVLIGVTFWEVIKYINAKPKPDTITENVDTTIITRKEDTNVNPK